MSRSGDFSKKIQELALKRQKNKCACCGTEISCIGLSGRKTHRYGESAHAHHIRPIRCGGSNSASNCVILCYSCHYSAHEGGSYRTGTVIGRKSDFEFFSG